MSKITIKAKEDVRKVIKADDKFVFDFTDCDKIFFVGPNGCGKSTIINAIRAKQCNNSDEKERGLARHDINALASSFDIEHDFDNIFILSSEFDDPLTMNNSVSADIFCGLGGYATFKLSNGQRSFWLLNDWFSKNESKLKEGNNLVIFDEIDKGYDLKKQQQFINLLRNLPQKMNLKILCVCHNIFPILMEKKVYYFPFKQMITSNLYMLFETGCVVNIIENPTTEDLEVLVKKEVPE